MTCLVDIDPDYCDRWELESTTRPKARKSYKCGECSKTIQPGEEYESYSGKSDRKFWIFRTCLTCVEIRDRFCCGGYEFGAVMESIFEALNEREDLDLGCLDDLSPKAVTRVCGMLDWLDECEGKEPSCTKTT